MKEGTYDVDWVESTSLTYSNNFGAQSVAGSFMRLKPMGKKGTFGLGINYVGLFGKLMPDPMFTLGYNLLYTNSYSLNKGRLQYSPAFIINQTPISVNTNNITQTNSDAMFILANSFTYRFTKRFTLNFGYTAIKSTNNLLPLINSFMIGSKIPF